MASNKNKGNWVKTMVESPKFKKGAFTKQAKRAGMSTEQFAKHALKPESKVTETTKRRARLSQRFAEFKKK